MLQLCKHLFIFNLTESEIYFCKIRNDKQTIYIWKLFDVTIPKFAEHETENILLGFSNKAVIFYDNVWIYGMDLNNKKVFKFDKECGGYCRNELYAYGNMV